jgi:hypothetical protein
MYCVVFSAITPSVLSLTIANSVTNQLRASFKGHPVDSACIGTEGNPIDFRLFTIHHFVYQMFRRRNILCASPHAQEEMRSCNQLW